MLLKLLILGAVVAVTAVGCFQNTPTPAAQKNSGTIRVGFPTDPDTADVPSLMAHELLQADGYIIERNTFETPELEVGALANGQLDISNGSTRTHWAAVAQGADIITLMQQSATEWALVARSGVTRCADLNGKRFGVQSAGSMSNALLQAYLKLECPGASPEVLFVPGSANRAAAMQKGELDGTLVQIVEQLELEKLVPGQFPTLFNYSSALPRVKTTAIYTRPPFAQANPEMVRDYLKAVLTVYRSIRENPELLYSGLSKYMGMDAATAKKVGDEYLARQIWDVNGGMTQEDVAYSLDFFTGIGNVPPGLDAAKLADLSYLDGVLKEIGRK